MTAHQQNSSRLIRLIIAISLAVVLLPSVGISEPSYTPDLQLLRQLGVKIKKIDIDNHPLSKDLSIKRVRIENFLAYHSVRHVGKSDKINNSDGVTELHTAARWNYPDIAAGLIKLGANPLVKSIDGKTPLDVAIDKENVEVIKVLLPAIKEDKGEALSGPLKIMVLLKRIDIVELLLEAGADPNFNNNNSSSTALNKVSSSSCEKEMVTLLRRYGAKTHMELRCETFKRNRCPPLPDLLENCR